MDSAVKEGWITKTRGRNSFRVLASLMGTRGAPALYYCLYSSSSFLAIAIVVVTRSEIIRAPRGLFIRERRGQRNATDAPSTTTATPSAWREAPGDERRTEAVAQPNPNGGPNERRPTAAEPRPEREVDAKSKSLLTEEARGLHRQPALSILPTFSQQAAH
eukprot:COSAG06_NODE_3057_length_5911_cov_29.979869_2_plen_161_part_00